MCSHSCQLTSRGAATAPPPNLQRKNDRLLCTMNKNCNPHLPGQSQLHLFFQKNTLSCSQVSSLETGLSPYTWLRWQWSNCGVPIKLCDNHLFKTWILFWIYKESLKDNWIQSSRKRKNKAICLFIFEDHGLWVVLEPRTPMGQKKHLLWRGPTPSFTCNGHSCSSLRCFHFSGHFSHIWMPKTISEENYN